jgi:hypothetical protein
MNDYPFMDGLLESTDEDRQCYGECLAQAIPLTALWRNDSDHAKFVAWDSEWEQYLKHRADLMDDEGRESHFPWRIYERLGLQWQDGYNFPQQKRDCASFGHLGSLNASNLTSAMLSGSRVPEIAPSIIYGLARGNGRMNFGAGLNLNPLSKWAAQKGNYWVSDFGRYDGGSNVRKYNGSQDANALKTQSIIIYVPEPVFDYCYALCAAGIGIHMGTGNYPITSAVNGDGLSVPVHWKQGGHAMSFVAAAEINSRRYLCLENSHGNRYAADRFSQTKQPRCWIDQKNFLTLAAAKFRYGNWYGNAGELG